MEHVLAVQRYDGSTILHNVLCADDTNAVPSANCLMRGGLEPGYEGVTSRLCRKLPILVHILDTETQRGRKASWFTLPSDSKPLPRNDIWQDTKQEAAILWAF